MDDDSDVQADRRILRYAEEYSQSNVRGELLNWSGQINCARCMADWASHFTTVRLLLSQLGIPSLSHASCSKRYILHLATS